MANRFTYLVELLDGAMSVEAEMDRLEKKVDFSAIGPVAEARLDKFQNDLNLQVTAINREAAKFGLDGFTLIDARQQGRKHLHEILDAVPAQQEAA